MLGGMKASEYQAHTASSLGLGAVGAQLGQGTTTALAPSPGTQEKLLEPPGEGLAH